MAGYDYSKGVGYYEEMRHCLVRRNVNNGAYRTGMDIILRQGLKSFFNKFKRKDARLNHSGHPQGAITRPIPSAEIDRADRELVYLLSEMIQAAGAYHGAK
jgi:hypothetical protein